MVQLSRPGYILSRSRKSYPTEILPKTLTIPWSPLNHVGKGGHPLGYTGNLWIQVYSIDGSPITSNPYGSSQALTGGALNIPAATTAAPFRVNRENRLVITGDHTTTLVAPPPLNASYAVVIREYPSEQDAILRTNWTGREQQLTVVTTGSWVIPPDSGYDRNGRPWSTPGYTIPDLANSYFVYELPDGGPSLSTTTRANRDPRYPSGYVTTNETPVLGAGSSCEMTRISTGGMLVTGRTIVLQEGDYNVPYKDGIHAGTVDIGTGNNDTSILPLISGTVGGGAVGGTAAAEYADGTFCVITMMKPSRTRFGRYTWNFNKTRFTSCYFKMYRPTLKRQTFTDAMGTGSSGTAVGVIAVTSSSVSDMKVDNSVFDPVVHNKAGPNYNAGTTLSGDNTSLCFYVSASGISNRITLVDNIFCGGTGSIYLIRGVISATNYLEGVIIKRNFFAPFVYQDYIKLTSCYNFDVQENIFIRGPATPSHPDGIQVNFSDSTNSLSVPGGIIKGNVFYSPADSYGGASIIFTNMGTTAFLDGLVISHNMIWDEAANGIAISQCTNVVVDFNTVLSAGDSVDPLPSENPRINNSGFATAASVQGNVHAYAGAPTIGGTADSRNTTNFPVRRGSAPPNDFASCLNNAPAQDADVADWTMATFISAFKAKSGGTFDGAQKLGWRGADGNYNT